MRQNNPRHPCPDPRVKDILPDKLSGRLDSERRKIVEQHLTLCDDCRQEIFILSAVKTASDLAMLDIPSLDVGKIVSALPARRRDLATARAAAVAIASIAMVILLFFETHHRPSADADVAHEWAMAQALQASETQWRAGIDEIER